MSEALLNAFYDIAVSPASFDFSAFCVCAESRRRAMGLDGIRLVIVPIERDVGNPNNALFDDKHLAWRIDNILLGIARLLPSVRGVTICSSRAHARVLHVTADPASVFPDTYTVDFPVEQHHTGWTVMLAHLGENIQVLRASPEARAFARQWLAARARGRRAVALTLREAPFLPKRNADPEVWGAFARRLDDEGYFPVIVRDIDKALGAPHPALDGFASFGTGPFNLDLRMALYEECHACAFVANGPAQLCFYDPEVRFIYLPTGDWLQDGHTTFSRIGVELGETPPFLNRYQVWIWREQDPDVLMDGFSKLSRAIERDTQDGTLADGLQPVAANRRPIAQMCERYAQWSERSFGMAREELRLAQYYRAYVGETETERVTLKNRISAALGANDFAQAIELMREHGARYGFTAEAYLQLGVASEACGRIAEALGCYESSLELEPGAPVVVYRLGVTARQIGDLAKARRCFEPLVERGSTYPELFLELGAVYETLGDDGRALALYDRAIGAGVAVAEIAKRRAVLASRRIREESRS